MVHRQLNLREIVSGMLVGVFLASGVVTEISGQAGSGDYEVPRTAAGHPNLQGFWTNQTYISLERPENVDKAFYTEEEVSALEEGRAVNESAQTTPGTIPDVHYDFTQFGLDRSQATFARNLRTSLIVDPSNGRLPRMNAEGLARAEAVAEHRSRVGRWDSAQANQLDDRCMIMRGAGPPMLNAGYNSNYQIIQNRDYVMILVEMIHDARIIPLDGRSAPPERVGQWMGLARGHWDGDTLVVNTTNINGQNPINGSSQSMTVTERFTRVSDDAIDYRFTVDDPATWDRSWTAEMPMKKTIGPMFEHACHEGNYGLYNTLVGARLEERLERETSLRERQRR